MPLIYVPPAYRANVVDLRRDKIEAIQRELNRVGCGPLIEDGIFGSVTLSAVKMFQTRRGLERDGVVGYHTWINLFGANDYPENKDTTRLIRTVINIAMSLNGTVETSPNRGPKIDEFIKSVGLDPTKGYSWCFAVMYWIFDMAAQSLGRHTPVPRTGGVLDAWNKAEPIARKLPGVVVKPGYIFMIDHGNEKGHAGLVYDVDPEGTFLSTAEGNTNISGSRNGDGFYLRTRRVSEINLGYLDYSYLG